MGFCCLAENNEAEALNNLEKSIEIDQISEKQQIAKYELIKLHFKIQNYDKASELIKDTEPYFYQNNQEYWLSVLFYKGFIYYYQGSLKKSEEVFEELLENAKDDKRKASALFGLAFITFSAKDYLKTINLCEAISSNDPQFFDMETLGFLSAASFFYLGRKDVFQDYYAQLTKKFPNGRYSKELEEMFSGISN
jgi:tetratricopeptide (TPR) repeat protein